MNCIFCQIIKREKPAKIYCEDKEIIVFSDIFPRALIHLLVCPKTHYLSLMDIPDELLLGLFKKIREMAKELNIEDNFRVLLNNGALSGQIVEHLHFHFMSNAS
ncbi:MAG: HIT domain-containing protein [candidate division Zixibacteria bacterium]|nr:HIT domain-containing protein [candidate division Zixibacteria bacterium]